MERFPCLSIDFFSGYACVMLMHVSIKCLSPQFSCPKGASDGDDRASFCHADYEWVAM